MTEINSPSTKLALLEALSLSEEILKNIELSEIPLSNIAMKTMRLARLLNDEKYQLIMKYEIAGYPQEPDGITPFNWNLLRIANRITIETGKDNKPFETAMVRGIETIEALIRSTELAIESAHDTDVSISSANPNQYLQVDLEKKKYERYGYIGNIASLSNALSSRKGLIYSYVLEKNTELKFSGIADDIFTRIRTRVDNKIGELLPDAIRKFSSIYESLQSENPEDWANAVNSCRRIIFDLADKLFPPTEEKRVKSIKGGTITISLGKKDYINRIIAFVEDNSDSERFVDIVGSNLKFLGDRLDSVFSASSKGTHNEVGKIEADRYVVYTYLIVGDLLTLNTASSDV